MDYITGMSTEERDSLGAIACAVEIRQPDGDVDTVVKPKNYGNLREEIKAKGASTPRRVCCSTERRS